MLWETTQQLQKNLEAKPLGPVRRLAGGLLCSPNSHIDDLLEHPVADVCPACYTYGELTALQGRMRCLFLVPQGCQWGSQDAPNAPKRR